VAIDQCERVLLEDTTNIKALYRISMALNIQNNQLEAWSYIKRAYKINPSDKAIKELYETLKVVKDEKDKEKESKLKQNESKDEKKHEINEDNDSKIMKEKDEVIEKEVVSEKAKKLRSAFKFSTEEEK